MPKTSVVANELNKRAQALYEAIKDSQDEEYIKRLCTEEREYLESKYSHNSLGTKLSQHYNQLFHSILLTQSNSFEDKTRLLRSCTYRVNAEKTNKAYKKVTIDENCTDAL